MTLSKRGNRKCDKHPKRYAKYTRIDKYNNPVDMCHRCRLDFLLNDMEILVCRYCDVMVRSEDDTRAKFPGNQPHKSHCPRFVRKPTLSVVGVEGESEDWDDWSIWEES